MIKEVHENLEQTLLKPTTLIDQAELKENLLQEQIE